MISTFVARFEASSLGPIHVTSACWPSCVPACKAARSLTILLCSGCRQVEVVEANARDERLLALLQQHHGSKGRKNRIIIFVLYKKEAPRVEALLKRRGWDAAAIHGDISQGQRTAAVEAFKAGTCPLLIATGMFVCLWDTLCDSTCLHGIWQLCCVVSPAPQCIKVFSSFVEWVCVCRYCCVSAARPRWGSFCCCPQPH